MGLAQQPCLDHGPLADVGYDLEWEAQGLGPIISSLTGTPRMLGIPGLMLSVWTHALGRHFGPAPADRTPAPR